MTDHEAIFGQARDVLMQHKSVAAVYRSPAGVGSPCRGILSMPAADRVGRGGAEGRTDLQNRRTWEVPTDPSRDGVACVEMGGQFDIHGVTWAIESIPAGAPGMHCVELVRQARTTHAGRPR